MRETRQLKRERFSPLTCFFLTVALVFTMALCVCAGSVSISFSDTVTVIWNAIRGLPIPDTVAKNIILNVRLPRVLCVALVGVAILGTSLALVRMTTSAVMYPLRVVARFYTTIMRGIPMLVVLYIVGFGIPGLGSVSINAIHSADMAVVRAVVVLGALLYQFVNLVTDLAYAALDPRVRFQKG